MENQQDSKHPTGDMIDISFCIFQQLMKLYPPEKQKLIQSLIAKTHFLHQLWKVEFQLNKDD
jgi:hypothetical protein